MTLILQLTAHKEAALKAKANAQGISAEQYVQRLLDHELEEPPESAGNKPIEVKPLQTAADIVRSHMGKVPPDMMAAMPTDGASQHDHYIYGWPKRDL